MFTDAGQYVHIAPAGVNQDLLRLDYMRHAHTRGEIAAAVEADADAAAEPAPASS